MSQPPKATWNDASKDYQSIVGFISLPSAQELLNISTRCLPITPTSHILDLGCGPGAITLSILSHSPSTPITAIDTSQKMLDELSTNVQTAGHPPSSLNLTTSIVNVNDIKSIYAEKQFSHIFASFILHIASSSFSTSARDIHSLLAPGGLIGLATFTPESDTFIIWDRVCRIFDPDHKQPPFAPDPDAWVTYHQVVHGLQHAGFSNVSAFVRRAPFPMSTVEEWVEFFFEWKNPVSEALMGPFFDCHGGIGRDEVKEVFRRVVRDEWDGGKNVGMEYILAVGRKQA